MAAGAGVDWGPRELAGDGSGTGAPRRVRVVAAGSHGTTCSVAAMGQAATAEELRWRRPQGFPGGTRGRQQFKGIQRSRLRQRKGRGGLLARNLANGMGGGTSAIGGGRSSEALGELIKHIFDARNMRA